MSDFVDYNLGTYRVGTTFDALPFTAARTPTAFANLASVTVTFTSSDSCQHTFTWTGTITNATTWAFTLPAITTIAYETGYYTGSFVFTDVNGRKKPYLRGVINIIPI
jgi:hypothetical protein